MLYVYLVGDDLDCCIWLSVFVFNFKYNIYRKGSVN